MKIMFYGNEFSRLIMRLHPHREREILKLSGEFEWRREVESWGTAGDETGQGQEALFGVRSVSVNLA